MYALMRIRSVNYLFSLSVFSIFQLQYMIVKKTNLFEYVFMAYIVNIAIYGIYFDATFSGLFLGDHKF
jgi:hypothetical protein